MRKAVGGGVSPAGLWPSSSRDDPKRLALAGVQLQRAAGARFRRGFVSCFRGQWAVLLASLWGNGRTIVASQGVGAALGAAAIAPKLGSCSRCCWSAPTSLVAPLGLAELWRWRTKHPR